MQLAEKTLKLLNDCIETDQGNQYRANLQKVLPHISDIYREDNDNFRSHLGASLIGKDCTRALWYGFRWASKSRFDGRMIRLFNRGHMEEARFIALLLTAGIKVYQQDEKGEQFQVSLFGGHFGGSGDGVGVGFPEFLEEAVLLEFKTHSEKSFDKLKKDGVFKAKFEHFIQMQIYLNKMGLRYAMYIAVNKNTDEIHVEIVDVDPNVLIQYQQRAFSIVFAERPLRKISEKESWYQCKYCEFHAVCHKGQIPERNCRTCIFSKPLENGTWVCTSTGTILNKQEQLTGCDSYERLI